MADVQLSTLGSVIKTAYESETNTNAFTDTEKTKLAGIETSATADQTGAEIKALYEVEANAFTDAQFTKLSGIETSATANPNAIDNVVEDTTPQLGGDLDVSGNAIVSISNGDIEITPDGTGRVVITHPLTVYNINAQVGTTYILALTDGESIVTMNNASPNTLTIPTNATIAFPVGTVIQIHQLGAGITTIAAAAGVTLTGNGGSGDTYSADIQTQYNSAAIIKIATNQWLISGDIDTVAA